MTEKKIKNEILEALEKVMPGFMEHLEECAACSHDKETVSQIMEDVVQLADDLEAFSEKYPMLNRLLQDVIAEVRLQNDKLEYLKGVLVDAGIVPKGNVYLNGDREMTEQEIVERFGEGLATMPVDKKWIN
jgi:hypothetical protein